MAGINKAGVLSVATVAMLCIAPAAQAETRDVGMGRILALQGNQALQIIKLELKATIRAMAPQLPSRSAVKIAALAPVNGAGARVLCAE